jgi:serine-type D-Ala-D-Ala carboxypeptidase/endopeptidase
MKALKIIGIIGLLLLIAMFGLYFFIKYRANNIKDTKNLEERIGKNLENEIQKQQLKGMVIGVVKGDKVFIKGFGTTKEGANNKPDSLTIFELASIGKLFTTAALQIGVSRNDFDLNENLAKYVSPNVTVSNTCKATLLNLATHTSGFPSLPKNMLDKMTDEQNPYKDLTINDLYEYLKTCKEDKPVGEFEYSNFGMGVLGHILELKYKKRYEDIIKAEICSKLNMTNTVITLSDNQKNKTAQGYDETGKPNPIWQDTVLTGAGSFLSNAADMVKFIKANLKDTYSPISPQLIACHKPQMNGEIGLGWHIANTALDETIGMKGVLWHNGGAGGYSSYLAIDKATKSGLILLSNSAKDITSFGMKQMLLVKNISFEN